MHPITPPQFIRQHILRMTIKDFAAAIGISGPRVSKHEEAGRLPERYHQQVITLARKAGKRLLRAWFLEVPFADGVPRD